PKPSLGRRGRGWTYEPPLVTYNKEGEWKYYNEYNYALQKSASATIHKIVVAYPHFGQDLLNAVQLFGNATVNYGFDSIRVAYKNNCVQNFYGYTNANFLHLQITYYESEQNQNTNIAYPIFLGYQSHLMPSPVIKSIGQYNRAGERIGQWTYYNRNSQVYKTEQYMIAWKDEEEKSLTGAVAR
ncbi:MAG: hypothetical protein ACRCYO_14765, partial [Bacteroidia bacterium]